MDPSHFVVDGLKGIKLCKALIMQKIHKLYTGYEFFSYFLTQMNIVFIFPLENDFCFHGGSLLTWFSLIRAIQVPESPYRICILEHELFYPVQTLTLVIINLLNIYHDAKLGIRRLIDELPKGLVSWSLICAL